MRINLTIPWTMKTVTKHHSDYANLVLKIGILFMELNDVVKYPDRDRLLAVLKVLMVILKAHNTRSKYALEILCLLCQQFTLLACQNAQTQSVHEQVLFCTFHHFYRSLSCQLACDRHLTARSFHMMAWA